MEKVQISKNLRELRKSQNLTQEAFGKLLGFSARTISDWECGNTEPDLATIKKIVKIFKISYEDLLD